MPKEVMLDFCPEVFQFLRHTNLYRLKLKLDVFFHIILILKSFHLMKMEIVF